MSLIKAGSRFTLVSSFAIAGFMGVNAYNAWESEDEVRAIAAKTEDPVQCVQLKDAATKLNSLGYIDLGGTVLFLGAAGLNLAARRRVAERTPEASPGGMGN